MTFRHNTTDRMFLTNHETGILPETTNQSAAFSHVIQGGSVPVDVLPEPNQTNTVGRYTYILNHPLQNPKIFV